MERDNTKHLRTLGSKETEYIYEGADSSVLEVFDNLYPDRDYLISLVFNEFTSLCPKTGQPDFATIQIDYIADLHCVESKSLKQYYFSFRQYGSFMESITNKILDDLVVACSPKYMKVTANFNPRGATFINVIAKYKK